MKVTLILMVIVLLLVACGGQPGWSIAGEGDPCTAAVVIDRDWNDGDRRHFYLLLKAEDGQIGQAVVSAYAYDSLQLGDETCVIR